jgi:surface protein
MFNGCYELTELDLSNFNTSKVTTFASMFTMCYKLTNIYGLNTFDTSNTTTMSQMFYQCYALPMLDLSHFNTSKVTDMGNMFSNCRALTSLDLSSFDMSKVTATQGMFEQCYSLQSLDFSHTTTSKSANMNSMFSGCSELETVIGLDMYSVTSASGSIFNNCVKLKNLVLKNIKANLQLGSGTSYGTLLSDESLINTFKELWDLTGSSSKKLTLSTPSNARTEEIYVKLVDVTDEMIAQDQYAGNKKPCVVCEPTDEGAMTLKEYGVSKNWSIA